MTVSVSSSVVTVVKKPLDTMVSVSVSVVDVVRVLADTTVGVRVVVTVDMLVADAAAEEMGTGEALTPAKAAGFCKRVSHGDEHTQRRTTYCSFDDQ